MEAYFGQRKAGRLGEPKSPGRLRGFQALKRLPFGCPLPVEIGGHFLHLREESGKRSSHIRSSTSMQQTSRMEKSSLEDDQLDVLQNIEFSIISVFREGHEVYDSVVMRALDTVINAYRAELRGNVLPSVQMDGPAGMIAERVQAVCETRLGRKKQVFELDPDGIKTVDVVLACLKKIRKSVERWNKSGGRQGYLQFASRFIV